MKKIMIAVAVLAAGFVSLQADEVVSSTIVGYKTVNVAAGKIVGLAVQFADCANPTTVAITDLVSVDVPRGANGLTGGADQIWVWENNAWTKYFYRVRGATTFGWIKYDPSKTAAQQSETPTTDTISNGASVFFSRSTGGAATLTLRGAVNLAAPSISTVVAAGQLVQLCNPWPVEFAITDMADCIPASDRKGANGLTGGADQIWVWENDAWTKYFYRVRGATTFGWIKYDPSKTAAQQSEIPTTDTIAVGGGFFFSRSTGGSTTVTFTKPASL